jgi:endo-1,4-beta-xylanase
MTKILLALILSATIANAAPSASGLKKWFGGSLGIDAHKGPLDWTKVFNWGSAIDLGLWYEWEPTQGNFQAVYVQNELAFLAQENPPAQYEIAALPWGYPDGQGPTYNEPSWLASLPPAQQVQEFINALKFLSGVLPPGSKVNLIAEPLHTNMSTVTQALGGQGATGYDGFIAAIKLARQYMPGLLLGIIDYNIECNDNQSWDPGATTRFIALLDILKANGAMPDYISCEGDFLENSSTTDLTTSMQRLGAYLPVEISQLDIESGTAGDDASQLATLQRVFIPLWQSPYVIGIAYFATDPISQSNYPGHVNDNLWRDDESHRPALDWLLSYIPTSNPPNVFTSP